MARDSGAPTKKFSFGACSYQKMSPSQAKLSPDTKILNLVISFEDALKLDLAIDECVRQLNSYIRNTTEGKRTALNLAIHLDQQRITVNEDKL